MGKTYIEVDQADGAKQYIRTGATIGSGPESANTLVATGTNGFIDPSLLGPINVDGSKLTYSADINAAETINPGQYIRNLTVNNSFGPVFDNDYSSLLGVYDGSVLVSPGVGVTANITTSGTVKITVPDYANAAFGTYLTYGDDAYLRVRQPGEDRPVVAIFGKSAGELDPSTSFVTVIKPVFPTAHVKEISTSGILDTINANILLDKRVSGNFEWKGKPSHIVAAWLKVASTGGGSTIVNIKTTKSIVAGGSETVFNTTLAAAAAGVYGAKQSYIDNRYPFSGSVESDDTIYFILDPSSGLLSSDATFEIIVEEAFL